MFFKTDSELFRSKYSQPLCTNHKGLHCRWPFIHFLLAPPSSGKLPFYFFWCSSPPIFCLCTFCKLTWHFTISWIFNGWSRGITFFNQHIEFCPHRFCILPFLRWPQIFLHFFLQLCVPSFFSSCFLSSRFNFLPSVFSSMKFFK